MRGLQVPNIFCNKNNILLFSNKPLHVANDNVPPSGDGFGLSLVYGCMHNYTNAVFQNILFIKNLNVYYCRTRASHNNGQVHIAVTSSVVSCPKIQPGLNPSVATTYISRYIMMVNERYTTITCNDKSHATRSCEHSVRIIIGIRYTYNIFNHIIYIMSTWTNYFWYEWNIFDTGVVYSWSMYSPYNLYLRICIYKC